jgi:hypothetical protein
MEPRAPSTTTNGGSAGAALSRVRFRWRRVAGAPRQIHE